MHVLRVYGAALLVPGLPIGILVWNVAGFWAEDGSAGLPARLTSGGSPLPSPWRPSAR